MKKQILAVVSSLILVCTAFVLSNPNCPTGYSTAPSLNGTTVRNCTSCHSDYLLNAVGGGVSIIGLPSTYTPGQTYPFSIKINHASADRKVWGFSIKAIDTLTHAVIGTWLTSNANTSIKGTPTIANGSYELSHANAATTTSTNTYTYSNLSWVAPSTPTAVQSRVKFYVSAVAGNDNGNEGADYVYTTSFTSNLYVAPVACTFTYGQWTTCNGTTQTRSYTTSPAGCTGTPPADSITRACTLPCTFTYGPWTTCNGGTQTRSYTTSPAGCTGTPPTDSVTRTCSVVTLPTPVTIISSLVPNICDTIRTFTVQSQPNVFYAWNVSGVGNYITDGQGTNTITAVIKAAGSVAVSLSNAAGSIPATTLAVTKALPPMPTTINGTLTPCIGSVVNYTLTNPIPTALQVAPVKFRWTKPATTTIISANADSSSVFVSFNTGYVGGSISAKGESACGLFGPAKTISFSPPSVINIVSSTGFWNSCIGSSVTYVVISPLASVTFPITVFRWTTPLYTTITSANADSSQITLQFNTGYRGGLLKVQSSTSCGALSSAATKTLTHLNCAVGQRAGVETLIIDQVSLYPNPNEGTFTLNVESSIQKNSNVKIQIFDIYGRIVGDYTTQSNLGVFNKTITNSNLKTGIYFVSYTVDNVRKTVRMIVQK